MVEDQVCGWGLDTFVSSSEIFLQGKMIKLINKAQQESISDFMKENALGSMGTEQKAF